MARKGCHAKDGATKCYLQSGQQGKPTAAQNSVLTRLVTGCVLTACFMVGEWVAGYLARSVAVYSDAAHMLSDTFGFLISIFAALAVRRATSPSFSYGYHRLEVLGALASVLIIWVVTGVLVFEAVERILHPETVNGKVMFIVGLAGLAFNMLVMFVLGVHGHLGHSHDQCSGHSHTHTHGHTHEQELTERTSSHSHGHSHTHGASCGHRHSHTHTHTHDAATAAVGHMSIAVDSTVKGSKPSAHSHDYHTHAHSHTQKTHKCDHAHTHTHECDDHTLAVAGDGDLRQSLFHGHTPSDTPKHAHHDAHHAAVTAVSDAAGHGSHGATSRSHEKGHTHSHGHACEGAHAHGAHAHGCAGHAHGAHENINVRSAFLHVLGDALQSIGVAIAGIIIWVKQNDPRWFIVDPICTFIFAGLVLLTTRAILVDIFHTLMECAPTATDVLVVIDTITQMDGVVDVHDFHVWQLTSGLPVMTAHITIQDTAEAAHILAKLEDYLRAQGIDHSTIQICNPPANAASLDMTCSNCKGSLAQPGSEQPQQPQQQEGLKQPLLQGE